MSMASSEDVINQSKRVFKCIFSGRGGGAFGVNGVAELRRRLNGVTATYPALAYAFHSCQYGHLGTVLYNQGVELQKGSLSHECGGGRQPCFDWLTQCLKSGRVGHPCKLMLGGAATGGLGGQLTTTTGSPQHHPVRLKHSQLVEAPTASQILETDGCEME